MSRCRTTTLSREELLTNIEQFNKSINEADDKMSAANRRMVASGIGTCLGATALCCCAVLMIGAGASVVSEGVHDMRHGNVGFGIVDIWAGSSMMSMGSDMANAAMTLPAANSNWDDEQTYRFYSDYRTRFTEQRTNYQKELYLLEKDDIFVEIERTNHPYRDVITKQFDAIDEKINQGQFTHRYVDIAVNTRNILMAKTEQEQKLSLEKHLQLATKKSIGKNVAGALLTIAGVGLITLGVLTAVATFGIGTPVSALLAGLGLSMTATAITASCAGAASLAGSIGFFISGRTKRRKSIPEESIDLAREKILDPAPSRGTMRVMF